jgi:hypothetical protein
MAIGISAIVSQLSKIFWLSLRFARDDEPPFFQRECKGKGLYISTKFFFDVIRIIWRENQLVL